MGDQKSCRRRSASAFRVGEQPYGLLPTTAFAAWIDSPGDDLADVEARIRDWALPWRAGAAAAARGARGRVHGADTRGLVDALGVHAPTRYWNARAIADLFDLQALRAMFGMPPLDTSWDDNTARALRGVRNRSRRLGVHQEKYQFPARRLTRRRTSHSCGVSHDGAGAALPLQRQKLGLVGHLMRESLIDARAVLGDAVDRLRNGKPIAIGQPLPWADETEYRNALFHGTNQAFTELRAGADANGRAIAERFKEVQEALQVIADLWEVMSAPLFRGVLAALDTAAFRVDPWLTGIAERRLKQMITDGAPFRLGAYGWVDAPAPYCVSARRTARSGPDASRPAPRALVGAGADRGDPARRRSPLPGRRPLEADARLREDPRRNGTRRARAARAPSLRSARSRSGKIAGDWDFVRKLREKYPLADDQQERRVCDGQKVLKAAREGTLVAGLPADLAAKLKPLDEVLDTYGDLLITDGVHALVTGRADLANAAMEAAAGLGAPPELRAVRTPREATTVRVSAWALLPAAVAAAGPNADPGRAADPAFAAATDDELGAGVFEAIDGVDVDRRRQLRHRARRCRQ